MRFLTLILILFSTQTFATQLTYRCVDSITYALFTTGRHEELKDIGKEALRQNIDFYYLRMRLGIVYYEETNYENALPHFVKANAMNPADTIAQEYLYYSYFLSDRLEDANSLASRFSPDRQHKINYRKKSIEAVAIGGGYLITDNISNRKDDNIKGNANVFNTALYNGNVSFANILLQHTFYKRLKLFYGASVFNTEALGVVQTNITTSSNKFSNYQYQYNLAASYQLKKGWNITGSFGYFQQQVSSLPLPFEPVTNFSVSKQNSYDGSLSFSKRMKFIQPILTGSFSNFQKAKQYQGEFSFVYYPLGNPNLYSTSTVAFVKDKSENNWIFSEKIGGKIFSWLWYEAKASYGNHLCYITESGFLTYNTPDPIMLVAGANLKFYWKHFELNTGYFYQQREGTYLQFDFSPPTTINYNYSNHLITTTLKWNF